MASVRSITAHFLGGYSSIHTRKRYKKDIVTWQRWCGLVDIHPLDCTQVNAQLFVDWMVSQYTSTSVASRVCGVAKWMDALVAAGVLKSHGLHSVKLPKRTIVLDASLMPGDDEMVQVMRAFAWRGPRWEWLAAMVAWGGCDCAEALRVRKTDVRTWEGKTLVTVRSRRGNRREIPVDGRLEVLTLGLTAVFAATTTLGGTFGSKYATETINEVASTAVGRRLTVQDMRRWAVHRQFQRGVSTAVIAKWMGHTNDRYVRQTLRLLDPVALVSQADVVAQIVVEPDGDRFGSGSVHDSVISHMADTQPL